MLCAVTHPARADASLPTITPADEALTEVTVRWLTVNDSPGPKLADRFVSRDLLVARPLSVAELRGRFNGAQLLWSNTYAGAPATLASDVSQALANIEPDIEPAAARLRVSDASTDQANTISKTWVIELLKPSPGDQITVAVLWHPASDPATPGRLALVMYRSADAILLALAAGYVDAPVAR